MTLLQTKWYEYNKYHSFVENIIQELNKCYKFLCLNYFQKTWDYITKTKMVFKACKNLGKI